MDIQTKNTLADFLNKDDRNKFIVNWLVEDHDIPKWKAKGMVKLVLAPLMALVGKVAGRGVSKIHEALRSHSSDYDEVSTRFSELLLVKLECVRLKKKYSKEYLNPPKGEDPENWKKLNEQTKVWIKQLQELELISLSLGDMQAKVRLHIDSSHLDKASAPSRWLRPYNTFIPLIGRDNEKEILNNWMDEAKGFSWKIIIGEGGIGKTRLAQEFAQDSMEEGWDAGFLDHEHLDSLVNHDNFSNWVPLADTLIIVDYAATKQESLKKLLHQCGNIQRNEKGEEEPVKLRLLFLERHADNGQGWVEELQKVGEGALKDEICDALHPAIKLEPPKQQEYKETMVSLLKATLASWEKLMGEGAPELPPLSEEDFYQLRSNTEGRPLYLQMAALHACEIKSAAEIVRWNRADLLQHAVERERDYIHKHCSTSSSKELIERLAALLYFADKIPGNHPALSQVIEVEAKTCGYPLTQPADIVKTLTQLFQDDDAKGPVVGLGPIQPDLIGAAFSATILQEQGNHNETLDRAIQLGRGAVWANLLRSAQDLFDVGTLELETWLSPLLEGKSHSELLNIARLLPDVTTALRFFAVDLYEALSKRSEGEVEQAIILNNLGNSYSDLGRREEALNAALKAVEIRERLAQKNPDAFEPDLAGCFNNLGNRYGALGRREEALDAALKAVEICERLAQKNPDAFEPGLAGSFNNLGISYSDLGRREEALDATLKAVEIRERLAQKNPDAFEPALATSLNNLGNRYGALGRREEALNATLKAVEIHERIAQKNPDAFEPDLAGSFNNLGVRYSALDRREEALDAALKAVEIRERLAQKNPDAFEPDLAMSFNNLGNRYRVLGRGEEALDASLKAIKVYERLVQKNPDAFEPALATSLGALGLIHLANHEAEQAQEYFERGIKLLSRLFQNSPQAFAGLMQQLAQAYLKSCEELGVEPDNELLEPIAQKLQELEGEQNP